MGLTYFGHPVACTAALKNIEIIERDNLLDNARKVGAHLQQAAQRLTALSEVGDARGHGLMLAVDLVADKQTKAAFPASARTGDRVFRKCLENGVIVRPVGDRIILSPPLIISQGECDTIISTLEKAIGALS